MKNIYLAGPLFTTAEREFNEVLHDAFVGKGFNVFLPQDFCWDLVQEDNWREVARTCVAYLHKADIIIAILDGPDVDSGTSIELGIALNLGNKPVIGIRTDSRPGEYNGVNAMVHACCDKIIYATSYQGIVLEVLKYLNEDE